MLRDSGVSLANSYTNAVLVALNDPEWGKMSNRAIADMCGVNDTTVMRIRRECEETTSAMQKSQTEQKRTGKDGKESTSNGLGLSEPQANGSSGANGLHLTQNEITRILQLLGFEVL